MPGSRPCLCPGDHAGRSRRCAMSLRRRRLQWLPAFIGAALILGATAAHAEVTISASPAVVVDQANVIDAATEQRISDLLIELRAKTTAEVKIITVQTTEDEDVFAFAQRHYDLWKLGAAGKDNGALIVLAIAQRQVRIHVGYGLEGDLPDIWCAAESEKVAKSYFSAGQYGSGLQALTNSVANKTAQAANIQLTRLTQSPAPPPKERRQRRSPQSQFVCCTLLIIAMLLGGFGGGRRRGRHYRRWGGGGLLEGLFWGSVLSRTFGNSGRSWGGGSGGGFGGFGGFGGGGFGGGGGFMGGGGFSGGGGGGASW